MSRTAGDLQKSALRVEAALDGFPDVRGHLDAATSGVPPLAAIRATDTAVTAWAQGRLDGPGFDVAVNGARAAFAHVVGAEPTDVACGASVSAFAGLIAAGLTARDDVLCAAGDFTSTLFPMLAQQARG